MGRFKYDENHINDIIDKYDTCIVELEDIEQLLSSGGDSILDFISSCYEGHGKEPAAEAVKKTSEHVLMLKECCVQTKAYVAHSLEVMKEADSK